MIAITVLSFSFLLLGRLESYLLHDMENALANQAIMARGSVEFALGLTGGGSLSRLDPTTRNALQALARQLAHQTACRILVTDQNGREVIYSASSTDAETEFGQLEEMREAIKDGYGADTRDDPLTHQYTMYVAYPIRAADRTVAGIIRVSRDTGSVRSLLGTIRGRIIISGLVAAAMAIIVSMAMAFTLAYPLRRIQEAATSFGRGELSARAGLKGTGEMADLSRAFDRMADRIERTVEELAELDRMKGQFVANVSHELKTPLAAIKGLSETLLDGAIDDLKVNRRFVLDILSESERLLLMVNNALNLAKLEAGVEESRVEEIDLKGVVAGVLERMEPVSGKRGVNLSLDAPEPLPAIAGDPTGIDQAIANLVDNAIKYSGTGDLVRVSLRESGQGVTVVVSDKGRGIAPGELDLVFERFFKAGEGEGTSVGAGLGLAIARHNVESCGGKITIQSELGAGTSVTIWLPANAID